ncbi:MAG: hypothetical protein ABI668_15110 [Sphingorhabdus sp.]
MTILLTSAMQQVSWMRCFRDAAEETGIDLKIIAVHNQPEASAACLLADMAFRVPEVPEENYIDVVLQLCAEHRAALLVPGAPYELAKLSASAPLFAEVGTHVATSGAMLVDLSRDAEQLNELAFAAGAARRELATRAEIMASPDSYNWPLKVVPRLQQDYPLGELVLRHRREMSRIPLNVPVLFTSHPKGERIVVQTLFDSAGDLVFAAPFALRQIKGEEAICAVTVNDPEVIAIVERLAPILPQPRGPLFMEFIRDIQGSLFLQSLSPMFCSHYPLVDRAGGKMATWLIWQVLSGTVPDCFQWTVGLTMLSYNVPLFLFENNRQNSLPIR